MYEAYLMLPAPDDAGATSGATGADSAGGVAGGAAGGEAGGCTGETGEAKVSVSRYILTWVYTMLTVVRRLARHWSGWC